jgi:hypothetical protein
MQSFNSLRSLPDNLLLQRLAELVSQSRRVEAELVAHIAEVDDRGLYASRACSSMFAYALEVLHLSEHEAYERITAARASRKYPQLLEMLADGRLHLSGLGKLAPHLTDDNCDMILSRAAHKTKRQIEELLVELSPKPDAPVLMRKLPDPPIAPRSMPVAQLGPDRVALQPTAPVPPPRPPVVEPLAPSRYKIQFTASGELRDKLERLQSLMDEDLATAIEAAVTEKLEKLEAKRYGTSKRPRKSVEECDTCPASRYIPAPVRRLVSERDGGRCTFKDGSGRRCTEHRALEFHHDNPYGRGGDHDPAHIRLLCRSHNLYLAERDYGESLMKKYRTSGGRVSEPAPGWFAELSLPGAPAAGRDSRLAAPAGSLRTRPRPGTESQPRQ